MEKYRTIFENAISSPTRSSIGPSTSKKLRSACLVSLVLSTLLMTFMASHRHNLRDGSSRLFSQSHKTNTSHPPDSQGHPSLPIDLPLSAASISQIQNSSLGFERIMVVNLPSRTDKADRVRLAASLTGINFTFISGVLHEDVAPAALPFAWPKGEAPGMGSWRAHMNAIKTIVREGLSSALILEDDIDWDVHVKSQLPPIAVGMQQLQSFAQTGTPTQRSQTEPHSPYGDNWDVLWLGHCASTLDPNSPRFLITNDRTMPPPGHIWNMSPPGHNSDSLPPNNSTRVVSANNDAICTLSYAVSLAGAQKILYELGTKPFSDPYDVGVSHLCNLDRKSTFDFPFWCGHVWPSMMNSLNAAGKTEAQDSDMRDPTHEHMYDDEKKQTPRDKGWSFSTVFSTMLNLGALIRGDEPERQWGGEWPYQGQNIEEGEGIGWRFEAPVASKGEEGKAER